jgi:hypothetical protein
MGNSHQSPRKSGPKGTGRDASTTAEEVAETFREADDHQASADQVRNEPLPASDDDDPRQEAVVRNEEHSHASGEHS